MLKGRAPVDKGKDRVSIQRRRGVVGNLLVDVKRREGFERGPSLVKEGVFPLTLGYERFPKFRKLALESLWKVRCKI
jgi:hypothetical protein